MNAPSPAVNLVCHRQRVRTPRTPTHVDPTASFVEGRIDVTEVIAGIRLAAKRAGATVVFAPPRSGWRKSRVEYHVHGTPEIKADFCTFWLEVTTKPLELHR
jgi:hypothetical protein